MEGKGMSKMWKQIASATRRGWMLVCLVTLISHGWADEKAVSPLVSLVVERLAWMDEVAEIKRAKGTPVADPVREEALLQAMEKQAGEAGLSAGQVRQFFAGQILAARAFQEDWLSRPTPDEWKGRPLPDLATDVRPRLDDIGRRMISALAANRKPEEASVIIRQAREALQRAGYTEVVIDHVATGLKAGLSITP